MLLYCQFHLSRDSSAVQICIYTNNEKTFSDYQYQKQVTAAGIQSEQPDRIRIYKERWKTLPCLIFRHIIPRERVVRNIIVNIQGKLGMSNKRRGKNNKSTSVTLDVQTYSAGGSFLKLEQVNIEVIHLLSCMVVEKFLIQDWRDSHLAYLQHKTCLSGRSNRPSSAGLLHKKCNPDNLNLLSLLQ